MLIWLVVLISLVVFIIAIVKTFRGWGVWHTVLLSILFVEGWTLVFFAAGVASRRIGYARAHDAIVKKVDKLEKELSLLSIGDRFDPALDLQRFVPLTNELQRVALERGRVWRGSTVENPVPATPALRLMLPPAPLPNAPAPAPAPNNPPANPPAPPPQDGGLPAGSVIYAFGEKDSQAGRVPAAYLGEFFVTESTNGAIKLRPTAPLAEEQVNVISAATHPTWALYELMPIDSHNAFATRGSKPDDNAIFGRMDANEISSLLGIDLALAEAVSSSLSIKDGIKASVLQSYVNDGGRAPDGTPVESLAKKVEFLVDFKNSKKEVDASADDKEEKGSTQGGFFDTEGKAVEKRLKREQESPIGDFKAGSTYVFDVEQADKLIQQKIAKLIAPVFVRKLNDYDYAFREVRRRTTAAEQESLLIKREIAQVNRSIAVGDEQILARQEERKKLDKNTVQYQKEADVVNAEAKRLEDQIAATRQQLTSLYTEMHALHDRLIAAVSALNDSIDAASYP